MRTALIISQLLTTGSVIASDSAAFSIAPQSQSTGTRSTSANYTLDAASSTGSVSTSTAFVLRSGFAGALADVTALDILASPATVNEGGTRQLSATLFMDDATQLLPAPAAISWSVLTGPVTVSATGLVTGGTVSANTSATVRGSYQSHTDTQALTVIDAGGGYNYASDSLPDDWQTQFFGNGNPQAAPAADPDGDGWDNLFEYTAGLIPTDAASRFSLTIASVPGQPSQKRIIFSPVTPGRTYTVQSPASLSTGPWQPLTGSTFSDSATTRTVTDTSASPARKFYRIVVTKP